MIYIKFNVKDNLHKMEYNVNIIQKEEQYHETIYD